MRSFDEILEIAKSRHGDAAMESRYGTLKPKTAAELAAIPDDRWLAIATRCIFQSGFNWKVIEAKWAGFEAAFEGFEPGRWVMANDDDIARLVSDKRIVRNGQKIASVPENARFVSEVSRQHGGFGRWIGDWPVTDYVGLLEVLGKKGSRLGAATGQYFLRFMGKDSFILSKDVTAALIREGVVEKAPTSRNAMAAVQRAFDRWMAESGLPMMAVSQTLARSIDG